MECLFPNGDPINQFPTAPENLSVDIFSDTVGELTWTRPSESRFSDDFATGYEIFRNGVFIERLPVVNSFFDTDTSPNASYEVRATRGLIAGASSFVNADGSDGSGPLAEPTEPTEPTEPAPPVDGSSEIGLTGVVYSSTALELFYNQSANSEVRYNIFRDGEIIRENSPATSQFEAGLDPNTSYVYEVTAVLNGNAIATSSITLTTFDDGSGATPSLPTTSPTNPPTNPGSVSIILSAAVYSSTSLELFWNRSSVAGVRTLRLSASSKRSFQQTTSLRMKWLQFSMALRSQPVQ